jgi:hypothetical protein
VSWQSFCLGALEINKEIDLGSYGNIAMGGFVTGFGNMLIVGDDLEKGGFKAFAKGFANVMSGMQMYKGLTGAWDQGFYKGADLKQDKSIIKWDDAIYNGIQNTLYNYGSSKEGTNLGQFLGYAVTGFASSILSDVSKYYLKTELFEKQPGLAVTLSSGLVTYGTENINGWISSDYKKWESKEKFVWNTLYKTALKGSLFQAGYTAGKTIGSIFQPYTLLILNL